MCNLHTALAYYRGWYMNMFCTTSPIVSVHYKLGFTVYVHDLDALYAMFVCIEYVVVFISLAFVFQYIWLSHNLWYTALCFYHVIEYTHCK